MFGEELLQLTLDHLAIAEVAVFKLNLKEPNPHFNKIQISGNRIKISTSFSSVQSSKFTGPFLTSSKRITNAHSTVFFLIDRQVKVKSDRKSNSI